MNTLMFNGSPRKNGETVHMIGELKKHLHGDVRIVHAYSKDLHPCVDCRYCWTESGCAQTDGMQEVYRNIEAADHIVIASPIYFSEITGQLLAVLSRLQTYYCAKAFRKDAPFEKEKIGAVLLNGGGDGSAERATATARTLLHQMGVVTILPEVLFHEANTSHATERAEICRALQWTASQLEAWSQNREHNE